MAVKPIPEGYHTFTPYFVVEGASDFMEFVKKAFGAQEIYRFPAPGGKVGHAEVRVGDSVMMLADTNPEFPPSKMVSYLYVPDVDATYKKALASGARSQREPANQFYGDRVATVMDRWGNTWSIGTHVEDVPRARWSAGRRRRRSRPPARPAPAGAGAGSGAGAGRRCRRRSRGAVRASLSGRGAIVAALDVSFGQEEFSVGESERTRRVSWQDPSITAKAALSLSGAAFLRAMAEGRIPPPPIAQLMGFELVEVEEGRVVFSVDPQEYHYNPIGMVHGGLAATLLDSAMGCAVHSVLPEGRAYSTLEIKVNYVRALKRESGRVRAIGKVVHLGGKVATAEGSLVDAADKLYAHGTTTCLLTDVSRTPSR